MADQDHARAVEQYNSIIDQYLAENARLKAEVERLRFAEDLLKDENKHFREEEPLPDGWNSSVAKACDLIAEKDKEIARLKAEVERLTSDIQMEKENEDRLVREWQKANNEVYGLKTQVAALIDDQTRLKGECQARQAENSVLAVECDSLKAEVEHLRKAGDKLVFALEAMDIIMDMDSEHPEVAEWNAAKEGKQS
jgi:chromosome segregation ATPase